MSKRKAERQLHLASILADWPEPTGSQRKFIEYHLSNGAGNAPHAGPSEYELEQRRKMQEREDALKQARKEALALTACDVCNLQPEDHQYSQRRGIDSHEWEPGRAEKIMKGQQNQ